MKFAVSNLALAHLVKENEILVNGFINKSQTTDDGLLKLKIHTKEGDKTILVNDKGFFISDQSMQAKQNPGGFSAFLKKYLFNQRIEKIEQHGMDRIVLFYFPSCILIFELFAKGNIILCDKEFNILRAMRREQWKDRTLEKENVYKFPTSKGINPLDETVDGFNKKMLENKKTCFGATMDILNVAPGILERVFDEIKFDKTKNAANLTKKELSKLFLKVQEKYSLPEEKVILVDNVLYSIDIGKEGQVFDSLTMAFNELTRIQPEEVIVPIKKKDVKMDYLDEIKTAEKNIDKYQDMGNAIYLHFNELQEIINAIKKGKAKGFGEKEVLELINSKKHVLKELDFTKNKVLIKL
ncbi:MAG: NFACT family protein [archaeon]|jgi:predicted ribosome quality control (RQC) complex YloA/Tae2 family protein